MSYRNVLSELSKFSDMKSNWYTLGVILDDLKTAPDGPPSAARRIKEAAELCGLSPNTLSRTLLLRKFFDTVKGDLPELAGVDANKLTYASIEILMRLHRINPDEALEGLREVVKGRTTFRKLRERYENTLRQNVESASPHQIALIDARSFQAAALQAAQNNSHDLFGKQLDIRPIKNFPVKVDAIGFEEGANEYGGVYSAFEFLTLIGSGDQKLIPKRWLSELLINAGFFSRFWVVVSSTIGDERIHSLCTLLGVMGYPSVGVAILQWDENNSLVLHDKLRIVHYPVGDPRPDWRENTQRYGELSHTFNRVRHN